MNTLDVCPCCSDMLLRHARHGHIYWFCSHCHREMPNLSSAIAHARSKAKQIENLTELLDRV